jgi:hypothetical protein
VGWRRVQGTVSAVATSGVVAECRTASRLDPRGPARLRSPWITAATAAIGTSLAIAALAPLPYPPFPRGPLADRAAPAGRDRHAAKRVCALGPHLRRAQLLPPQALGACAALRPSRLAAVSWLPWLRGTATGPLLGRHDTGCNTIHAGSTHMVIAPGTAMMLVAFATNIPEDRMRDSWMYVAQVVEDQAHVVSEGQ